MKAIDVTKLIEHFNEVVEIYKYTNSDYKFGALVGMRDAYILLFGEDYNSAYMHNILKEL